MAKNKIDVKIWSERLNKKVEELSRLTGKETSQIVASSMDHFLRSAGTKTPKTKKKNRNIEKSTKGRDWVLFAKSKAGIHNKDIPEAHSFKNVKHGGRVYFFWQKRDANRYKKIKNRGIGQMGWWISLARLAFNASTPRGFSSDISGKAQKYSFLKKGLGFLSGKPYSEAGNRVKNINRFGDIAYKLALRSTAKWIGGQVNVLKRQMKQQFNRAA